MIGVKSFLWCCMSMIVIKFIYSEKATQFCKISTVHLTYTYYKYKVEISENFVAFSEYMNFKEKKIWIAVKLQADSCLWMANI